MSEKIYTINQIREKLNSVFKRYGIRRAILGDSLSGKGIISIEKENEFE